MQSKIEKTPKITKTKKLLSLDPILNDYNDYSPSPNPPKPRYKLGSEDHMKNDLNKMMKK